MPEGPATPWREASGETYGQRADQRGSNVFVGVLGGSGCGGVVQVKPLFILSVYLAILILSHYLTRLFILFLAIILQANTN